MNSYEFQILVNGLRGVFTISAPCFDDAVQAFVDSGHTFVSDFYRVNGGWRRMHDVS